jgi:hypothetical protein
VGEGEDEGAFEDSCVGDCVGRNVGDEDGVGSSVEEKKDGEGMVDSNDGKRVGRNEGNLDGTVVFAVLLEGVFVNSSVGEGEDEVKGSLLVGILLGRIEGFFVGRIDERIEASFVTTILEIVSRK